MTITMKEYREMIQEIKDEADEIYGFRGYGWDTYVDQQIKQLEANYDIAEEED